MSKKVRLTESNLIKTIKKIVAEQEQRAEPQIIGKHWQVSNDAEPLTDEQVQKLNTIIDGWDKGIENKFAALHKMLHASKEWKEFIGIEDELGEVMNRYENSQGTSDDAEGNPEYDELMYMIAEEYLRSVEDDLHENLFYATYPGGSDWY